MSGAKWASAGSAFATNEQWGISERTGRWLSLAPLVILGVVVVLRTFARGLWVDVIAEEGPIELVQFVLLVCAVIASAAGAARLGRTGRTAPAAVIALGCLGLIFIAGEEVAWGQLVLDFETPAGLAEANYKEEASLHNVSALADAFEFGKLLVGAFGVWGGWLLTRVFGDRHADTWSWFVVPRALLTSFAMILVMRVLRYTVFRTSFPAGYGEVEEVFFAFALAAYTALVARRSRRRPEPHLT